MNIQQKLFSAYAWNVAGKWGARLLGIGSTLILVRLINPESFGLVALATFYIGLFQVFTDISANRYAIAKGKLSDEQLNTNWSYGVVLRLTITLALVLSSEFLASFVNEPQLALLIVVISINGFFASFNNVGLVRLESELDFKRITLLGVATKFLSIVVTVTVAFYYPNHWALIAGGIVSVWFYLVGSYLIYPYSPRFSLKRDRELLSFSSFVLIRGIVRYFRNKADTFFVARFFNASSVGKYNIGLEFASLPFSEVIMPASQAMFPGLAQFRDDRAQLFDKTYKYFAMVYMFVIPSMVGIWVIAEQFTNVILGEKWVGTGPIMAALAVMMLPYTLTGISNNLYDFLDKTKASIFNDAIGLLLLLFLVFTFTFDDVGEFAEYRGWVGFSAFVIAIIYNRLMIKLSLRKMLLVIGLPSLAGAVMYTFFEYVYVNQELTMIGMLINMTLGALVYSCTFLALLKLVSPYSAIWRFWHEKVNSLTQHLCRKVRTWQKSAG